MASSQPDIYRLDPLCAKYVVMAIAAIFLDVETSSDDDAADFIFDTFKLYMMSFKPAAVLVNHFQ